MVAACLMGAYLFYQHIEQPDTWQFYASLIGLAIFILFAIIVFKKTG